MFCVVLLINTKDINSIKTRLNYILFLLNSYIYIYILLLLLFHLLNMLI